MAPLAARLSDLAADVLFTSVQITEIAELTTKFLKATLRCDAFTRTKWTPGDKLQLRPRRGSLAMRTYTPINWNPDKGTLDVIAYRHGDGPAVRWFDDAVRGSDAEIYGPSKSLDLSDTVKHTVFVGDETSIALAHVLQQLNPGVKYLYEASDPATLSAVFTTLGIGKNASVLIKSDGRRELLQAMIGAIQTAKTGAPVDLVVTGDAATVNAVRRELKTRPDLTPRIKARAYWASGRTGLS
jgi:NADPH-dependent ferric siderophore reductase